MLVLSEVNASAQIACGMPEEKIAKPGYVAKSPIFNGDIVLLPVEYVGRVFNGIETPFPSKKVGQYLQATKDDYSDWLISLHQSFENAD